MGTPAQGSDDGSAGTSGGGDGRPLLVSFPDGALAAEVGVRLVGADASGGDDALPGVEAVLWDLEEPPSTINPAARERLSTVVLPYHGQPAAIGSLGDLPSLRVVQTQTTGYDAVAPHVPDGVRLLTAAGAHDAGTAEIAVALLLGVVRRLDEAVRDAAEGRWRAPDGLRQGLAGRRVLVLGAGGIGDAVVRRLVPFEVDVVRVATRARTDDLGPVHAFDELPDLLPGADALVLAVPLTDATRGMVDAEVLAALPDGAVVVNVARGPVVDTDALVAELRAGRLRAGLDVTDPEPLPADHPLWSLDGALVTPHVGGATDAMRPRVVALLRRQLRALVAGDDLENEVG
ncbi:2-hydroxyacid dehydrogenase [Pseudokineococcus lusitanus]|uniref:Phosphoglycerate dehydrogenase-like enzyme n=1 Tax=Pseudokineococcus lusitanus TaxID=763993 RepID=A0A3N1HMT1_9ACTN|nr:2-hydroxyacid dehydrogenase [Pseudokineococcus lusitanus]ROP43818.1 phosphoglycerate dehydrogenase-like enzyme [Pseudokineococcus lusitanus]